MYMISMYIKFGSKTKPPIQPVQYRQNYVNLRERCTIRGMHCLRWLIIMELLVELPNEI